MRRAADIWPAGSLLAGLSDATRSDLLALGTLHEYAAGSRLLTQGERSRHLFLLLDGWVKVTSDSADGHVSLLAVRVRGDAVGELASLDDAARSATVSAVGLVRARRVSHQDLQYFLAQHPDGAVRLATYISTKLRWATERRIEFGAFPVAVRVARVLVSLARDYGNATAQGFCIGVEISQPDLAGLIGASEPSVHRALRELKRVGVLDVGYRQFTIEDIDALVTAARLTPVEVVQRGLDRLLAARSGNRS
ncbi:MAG TPA: Crp/Fnr family transcriptional regulator [Kineosporiaceae bacterium]